MVTLIKFHLSSVLVMKRVMSVRRTSALRRLRPGSDQGLGSSSSHGATLVPLHELLGPLRPGLCGYYPDWERVKAAGPLAIAALCQQSTTFDADNPYYQTFEILRSLALQAHWDGSVIDLIDSSIATDRMLSLGNANNIFVPIGNFCHLILVKSQSIIPRKATLDYHRKRNQLVRVKSALALAQTGFGLAPGPVN